ncbi:hypothetical protein J6590_053480 [Homalodisca vitripennis]|nr:hypothetical protein J6590_053480 [Homalodisca vitripennis]
MFNTLAEDETLMWVIQTKRSPGAVDIVQASEAQLLHWSWVTKVLSARASETSSRESSSLNCTGE